jgi:hypothetical protein
METKIEKLTIKLSSNKMNKADKEAELIDFVKDLGKWVKAVNENQFESETLRELVIVNYSEKTGMSIQTLKLFIK